MIAQYGFQRSNMHRQLFVGPYGPTLYETLLDFVLLRLGRDTVASSPESEIMGSLASWDHGSLRDVLVTSATHVTCHEVVPMIIAAVSEIEKDSRTQVPSSLHTDVCCFFNPFFYYFYFIFVIYLANLSLSCRC